MTVFQPKDWESGASADITLLRIVEEKMPKEYVENLESLSRMVRHWNAFLHHRETRSWKRQVVASSST
jgi:hypothetical protein